MPTRAPQRIGVRLAVPLASVTALLAFVLVVLQLRAADRRANESLDSYSNLLAGVVLEGLREAMVADDRPRLKKQLRQFAESDAVRRIDVVATDGRVAFSSEPGFAGTEYSRTSPDCNVCHGLETPPPNTARTVHYAEAIRNTPVYRIVLPIDARKECLECHEEVKVGQKLGILLLDLDESKLVGGQLRGARVLSWALAGAFGLLLAAVFVIVRVLVVSRLRNVRRAVEIVRSGALVTATEGQAFDEIDEIERLVQCLAEDAEDRRSLDRATVAFNSLLDRCPEPVLLVDGGTRALGASPSYKRLQVAGRGAEGGAPRPALPAPLPALMEHAKLDGWALGDTPEAPLVATVEDVRGSPLLFACVWPPTEGTTGPEGAGGLSPDRTDPEWRLYTAALVSGLSAEPKRWKGVLQLDRRLTSGKRVAGDLAAAAAHAAGERREVELRTMIQVVLWEVSRQVPAVTWHTILDDRHTVLGSRYQLRTLVRRLAEAAAASR